MGAARPPLRVDEMAGVISHSVELPFTAHHAEGQTSILLIHGAFVDHTDWDLVAPYLSPYHLLIPDLPAHGKAAHIQPFSKQLSARLLADLIRSHAQGGKAHIIGLSLGAFVALELASVYPDVVRDLFISGVKVLPASFATGIGPYGMWLDQRIQNLLPRSLISWAMDGTDIQGGLSTAALPLCRAIMATITFADTGGEWPCPWPARTCIISAGKAGIVPSADHPGDAVKLREIARRVNADTMACTHPLMRHPWNRQAPELFAQAARNWVEGRELPGGFELLA